MWVASRSLERALRLRKALLGVPKGGARYHALALSCAPRDARAEFVRIRLGLVTRWAAARTHVAFPQPSTDTAATEHRLSTARPTDARRWQRESQSVDLARRVRDGAQPRVEPRSDTKIWCGRALFRWV